MRSSTVRSFNTRRSGRRECALLAALEHPSSLPTTSQPSLTRARRQLCDATISTSQDVDEKHLQGTAGPHNSILASLSQSQTVPAYRPPDLKTRCTPQSTTASGRFVRHGNAAPLAYLWLGVIHVGRQCHVRYRARPHSQPSETSVPFCD